MERESIDRQFVKRLEGKSKNVLRDFEVLKFVAMHPGLKQNQVIEALSLDMTQGRVAQLLKRHRPLLYDMFAVYSPLMRKEGRLFELVRMYEQKKQKGTKKDVADILEQIRRELDDKPLIDNSVKYAQVKVIVEDPKEAVNIACKGDNSDIQASPKPGKSLPVPGQIQSPVRRKEVREDETRSGDASGEGAQ